MPRPLVQGELKLEKDMQGPQRARASPLEWWEIADRSQQKEGLHFRARGPQGAPRGKSLQSREILRSKAGQES